MKNEFHDYRFCSEYPSNRVAEHEVFMSFTNDEDAVEFREWWVSKGRLDFGRYLAKKQK